MFIHETELKGFKAFQNTSFAFSTGRTIIELGQREGRTSFIEALLSGFLPLLLTELSDKISLGKENASVRIRLSLNSHDLTINKSWTHTSVTHWTVISASFKKYNLLDDQERLSWLKFFLKETAPAQMSVSDEFLNEKILLPLYSLLIRLASGPSADIPKMLTDSGFRKALCGMAAAAYLAERSASLQPEAKKYDEENRQAWSRNVYHKKQTDDLRREFEALNAQIQSNRDNLSESETTLEKIKSELKQQEHIRIFIGEKQTDIEKIDFEISTFESLLNESFTGLSPDEFKAIEIKKKKYDELESRVTELEGKLIERRHLEKNLSGLIAELETSKTENGGQKESDKRRRTYESEIRRIQDNLRSLTGTESALQAAREKLSVYVQDHHHYEVLLKARDWMNQNDRKKISNALSRAKKRKLDIENELSPLQGEPFEKKSADLQKQIHSTEQSLIHIRLSLYDLQERQKKIAAQINQASAHDPESAKTPMMPVGRYLKMYEAFFANRAEKAAEESFTGFWDFAIEQTRKFKEHVTDAALFDRIEMQLISHDPGTVFSNDGQFSESEIFFRNLLLRILLIRYFTNLRWIVFDENVILKIDADEVNSFLEYCEKIFEQALIFRQ